MSVESLADEARVIDQAGSLLPAGSNRPSEELDSGPEAVFFLLCFVVILMPRWLYPMVCRTCAWMAISN